MFEKDAGIVPLGIVLFQVTYLNAVVWTVGFDALCLVMVILILAGVNTEARGNASTNSIYRHWASLPPQCAHGHLLSGSTCTATAEGLPRV